LQEQQATGLSTAAVVSPQDGDVNQLQASSQQEAADRIAEVLEDRVAPDGAGPIGGTPTAPIASDIVAGGLEPGFSPQVDYTHPYTVCNPLAGALCRPEVTHTHS